MDKIETLKQYMNLYIDLLTEMYKTTHVIEDKKGRRLMYSIYKYELPTLEEYITEDRWKSSPLQTVMYVNTDGRILPTFYGGVHDPEQSLYKNCWLYYYQYNLFKGVCRYNVTEKVYNTKAISMLKIDEMSIR